MQTILITGANRGIGLEFVRQYAAEGAKVHACARRPEDADALSKIAHESGGKVCLHRLDVADFAAIDLLAQSMDGEPIDLLINNAGIYGPQHQTADRIDYDGWGQTFTVNTMAPVRMVQAFLPNLKAGSGKKVVTITSQMGSIADNNGGYYVYRSAKAALNSAMKGLSVDLAGTGLTVVVLHPGWVKTDMGGPDAPLEPEDRSPTCGASSRDSRPTTTAGSSTTTGRRCAGDPDGLLAALARAWSCKGRVAAERSSAIVPGSYP